MKNMIGGIVAVCLGLWGMNAWWVSFGLVMRGMVPFLLLGFGLLAIISGFRRLSEGSAEVTGSAPPPPVD